MWPFNHTMSLDEVTPAGRLRFLALKGEITDLDELVGRFTSADRGDPVYCRGLVMMLLSFGERRLREAIPEALRLAELAPDDPRSWHLLGRACARLITHPRLMATMAADFPDYDPSTVTEIRIDLGMSMEDAARESLSAYRRVLAS